MMTEMTQSGTAIIKVSGLHKKFGNAHILKGIDLDVNSGEVVVIMGPSGAGKSTFLRCLNFLDEPSAGTIEICGLKVDAKESSGQRNKNIQKIRRQAAMVFQDFNLFPHMTVLENITRGAVAVKKVPKAQANAKAQALLDRYGLWERRNDFPARLAVGAQQQVAIARSLCMEPQVILFDDPTSSLDPTLVRDLVATIAGLAEDGMTMIIVTNEPYLARSVASRVILLDDGQWQEIAPPEEFFTHPQKERTRQFLEHISLKDVSSEE
ncbi:MAG: amino acid ABC transporter ATP-binding protein [Anaerolineales bacterium]|jgi:ABC-type polar amino acid transport system ATPase subunit